MKKQFINPAVRVVKLENNMLCASGDEPNTINIHAEFNEGDVTLAPSRGVFGDSDF